MFKVFKWVMQAHFRHLHLKSFPMVYGTLQSNEFWPLKLFSKNLRLQLPKWKFNWECVGSFPRILSHFWECECDFRVAFSAHTFPCPCLSHKPKTRLVTLVNEKRIDWDEHLFTILFSHRIVYKVPTWYTLY